MSDFVVLLLGVVILYGSAEALVKSSVKIANLMKMRTFIIGATIVSLTSSIPELSISLTSLSKHHSEIMLGNIIGSNIANILLVIGVASLIRPWEVKQSILPKDKSFLYIATVIFSFFAYNAKISRIEGMILFACFIAYNFFLINKSKAKQIQTLSNIEAAQFYIKNFFHNYKMIFFIGVGVIGSIGGSFLIVNRAVNIANILGIKKIVISISLVSIATALPELGMAIVSSIRKQTELILGNVIGSNIYNLFFVTGLSVSFFPVTLAEDKIHFQLGTLILISFLIYPFSQKSFHFSRSKAVLTPI